MRVPHYDASRRSAFRVSANGTMLAYSGDSAARATSSPSSRGTPTSSCARRRWCAASSDGGRAGTSRADEAWQAFEAAGAKRLLLTHRPSERALAERFEQATDGMEVEVDAHPDRGGSDR